MDVSPANTNIQISDVFTTAEPLQSYNSINEENVDFPPTVLIIEEMHEEGTRDIERDDLFEESCEGLDILNIATNESENRNINNEANKNENNLVLQSGNDFFMFLNHNDFEQYNGGSNPLDQDECVILNITNALDTVNSNMLIKGSKRIRSKNTKNKNKKKYNLTGKLKNRNESILISDDEDLQPSKRNPEITRKIISKEVSEPTEETILKEFYFEDEDICIVDELKVEGPQKTLVRRTKNGYHCPLYCTFVAEEQPMMIIHLINHKKSVTTKTEDNEAAFECPMCPFMTFSHSIFVKHICCHKKSSYKVLCSKCPFSTNNEAALKKHLADKHAPFLLCQNCHFKTRNKLKLRKHELNCTKHISFEGFKCRFEPCPFTTSVKQHMETHEWIQHQVDSSKISMYKCPLEMCFFETFRKALFDDHMLMHTGEAFKCQLCNRRTGDFNGFKEHILEHISTP